MRPVGNVIPLGISSIVVFGQRCYASKLR